MDKVVKFWWCVDSGWSVVFNQLARLHVCMYLLLLVFLMLCVFCFVALTFAKHSHNSNFYRHHKEHRTRAREMAKECERKEKRPKGTRTFCCLLAGWLCFFFCFILCSCYFCEMHEHDATVTFDCLNFKVFHF